MDWYSRYVVSWALSDSLENSFVLAALREAYIGLLEQAGIQISMDGRRRCLDNIFTERLWRTVKYEEVFLQSYENLQEAHAGLTTYFQFYNHTRPHQSLDNRTPAPYISTYETTCNRRWFVHHYKQAGMGLIEPVMVYGLGRPL
jgi:putative transposase